MILADQGHLDAAARAFRHAVAAKPSYATAHFNLGLVLNRMGPSHLFEAQGELARATRLEPELREHARKLISDRETFFTTLDLSKPLPPTWHFSSSEKRTPVVVAGVVLALLLFRLLRVVTQDRMADKVAEHALDMSSRHVSTRLTGLGRRIPGAVAVIPVVAVFLYPLVRSSGTTTSDLLLLGFGVSVLTIAFMRLRTEVARRSAVPTRHYACVPAVLVGAGAALVGIGYAPMPATEADGDLPRRARWIGTGLLGLLSLALLVVGRLTYVPAATEFGAIGLVMTVSALVPVEPYDGSLLDEGHRGLLVVGALVIVAALLELGIL